MKRRDFLGLTARAGAGAWAGALGATALAQVAAPRPLFTDVPASVSGLTWTHDNAVSVTRFLPESLGPGCAFLDYDNDGWMDIYLVNTGPSDFYTPKRPSRNALFRNNRDGTFTDVTEKAGVAGGTFGTGVAVGDYNNDGLPDLFVTAYGRCTLYRNNGDGTFSDVTERAGVAAPGFTASAVWFDYDGDGLLDLFVSSYVDYSPQSPRLCADRRGDLLSYHYCIPHLFKPTTSTLFRNNGNGTFRRVDDPVLRRTKGKALGVVATDVNNDGRLDLVVSNDTAPNLLLINRAGGWQEQAVQQGLAYGASGQARSGMGVDAADIDGDGWQDLVVGNIDHEMYALYRNSRGDFFTDVASDHGLAQATRLLSGWGLKFFDFDNDGAVDLFLGNGHPDDTIAQRAPEVRYRQPPLLFRNDGRRLQNVSATAGPVFQKPLSVRGLAVGDYDNDGGVDVLLGCNGGTPVLLHNEAARGSRWAGVRLQGVRANRDAIGARIAWSAGGTRRSKLKTGGGSYLSSHDPRDVLGLGASAALDWVEVTWPKPSELTERFTDVAVGKYTTLREGEGTKA